MPSITMTDGAVATELRRAGVPVAAPWWATRALVTGPLRETLQVVHERSIAAGADVITANTFRCNRRALERVGLRDAGQGWMVHAAVGVAEAARRARDAEVRIAGSIAPVEDCYRPDLAPDDDVLREEHAWLAVELYRAQVDLLIVETANSIREARIATEQAVATGLEVWTGLGGIAGARLRSGERVAEAARAVTDAGASTVLAMCTTPEVTGECLAAIQDSTDARLGVSPNLEDRSALADGDDVDRVLPAVLDPEEFAAILADWSTTFGVEVMGGCCGTTPEHVVEARRRFPGLRVTPLAGA